MNLPMRTRKKGPTPTHRAVNTFLRFLGPQFAASLRARVYLVSHALIGGRQRWSMGRMSPSPPAAQRTSDRYKWLERGGEGAPCNEGRYKLALVHLKYPRVAYLNWDSLVKHASSDPKHFHCVLCCLTALQRRWITESRFYGHFLQSIWTSARRKVMQPDL